MADRIQGRDNKTYVAASVDEIMANTDSLMRFSPLYGALDEAGRARLAGPMRRAFARYVGADGSVRIPATANVAVGRKV